MISWIKLWELPFSRRRYDVWPPSFVCTVNSIVDSSIPFLTALGSVRRFHCDGRLHNLLKSLVQWSKFSSLYLVKSSQEESFCLQHSSKWANYFFSDKSINDKIFFFSIVCVWSLIDSVGFDHLQQMYSSVLVVLVFQFVFPYCTIK